MTCIAGVVEDGTVWMGADSAGVRIGDYGLTIRADGKLFRNGPMLFGFTSSFRMGQVLQHALTVPDRHPKTAIEKYMATTFVDAVRAALKAAGFATRKDEGEQGGTFMVGYGGRLFTVHDDYQIGEALHGIDAVGCGYQIAQGALYASALRGEARVKQALDAAEQYSAGVRGPFRILSVGPESAT